jgi:hypothetical protein
MDRFTGPTTDRTEEAFLQYGIIAIVISLYSSDQMQDLDLGVFALAKLEVHRVRPHDDFSVQSKKLIKMLGEWFKATVPSNIVKAFLRASITSSWVPGAGITDPELERAKKGLGDQWLGVIKPSSKLIQRIHSGSIWDDLTDRSPVAHGSGEG